MLVSPPYSEILVFLFYNVGKSLIYIKKQMQRAEIQALGGLRVLFTSNLRMYYN
jgi:hypothetical protein